MLGGSCGGGNIKRKLVGNNAREGIPLNSGCYRADWLLSATYHYSRLRPGSQMTDEQKLTDQQFQQALAYCRKIGASHGKGSAQFQSQYFPGGGRDTGRDASGRARRALADLERGSIDCPSPLSGEWAGDFATHDLLAGIADELCVSIAILEPDQDEFANEYEFCYREAWVDECARILSLHAEGGDA